MASSVPNRLISEKSPYLMQHAYNPVDWYPWGEEAFEKARREDKPILVSIGYSTCHWCHVMEHESYENPDIAGVMNEYLINIKVDREERPDIDKIYMTAVTAITGSGGWPLNVFLTPDLKPFFGGTYFPPAAKWGQPAWPDVVRHLGVAWRNPEQRKKILQSGQQMADALQHYAAAAGTPQEGDPVWLDNEAAELGEAYDPTYGGFGQAPKFPMPVYHNFLLHYYARTGEEAALNMSLHTLLEMAKGGIYDHIGGGFARYSTDSRWHIPHFEKMLYDNAQLAVNYIEAYQITHKPDFQAVAREILTYIHRDMTHPQGGFYSAEDADSLPAADASHKVEGAFYVWEQEEIFRALEEKAAELFCFRYGIREKGNAAQDPHGEFHHKNILYIAHPIPEMARHFKMPEEEILQYLKEAQKTLFAIRAQRPRPHLDDKIISAWNGLMISAYAKAYQAFGLPQDLALAQKAARFLQSNLYDSAAHRLYRRWRAGERQFLAIADDYAFVVQGLLDLYEADFDVQWLQWSLQLTEELNARFYDADRGGFYMTAADQDPHLLVRVKEDSDNVEPCASSIAALNLFRLSRYFDRGDLLEKGQRTLQAFGTAMKENGRSLPQMLVALASALTERRQYVVVGPSPNVEPFLRALQVPFMPVRTIVWLDGGKQEAYWKEQLPFLKEIRSVSGRPTVYLCEQHTCKQPLTDLQTVKDSLKIRRPTENLGE